MLETKTRSELKRLARKYLTGNYPTPMLAMLLATLCPTVLMSLFPADDLSSLNLQLIIYIAATLIITILGQLLTVGVLRMHLSLARKQPVKITDLLWSFRSRADHFILGTALFMLVILLPLLLSIAAFYGIFALDAMLTKMVLLLSGLTGCIATVCLYCTYSNVFLLYLEHEEYGILEGFRVSRTLMRGHKWSFFLLQVSFIGWYLLGICSAGIGFLWISPYVTQTTVNFYLDITGKLDAPASHIDATVTDHTPLFLP